jgi:hypothetical protein
MPEVMPYNESYPAGHVDHQCGEKRQLLYGTENALYQNF